MVTSGLPMCFVEQRPPQPRRMNNHPLTPEQERWVEEELQQMEREHIICSYTKPLVLSPLGVVEGKKRRLVMDLRYLNQHLVVPKIKFESYNDVASQIRPGDWLTKVDLKKGYLHVPMNAKYQRYLGFHFGGKNYVFRAMPFGLSSAPAAFTKLLRPVAQLLRQKGLRLVIYLDDILLMSDSYGQAVQDVALLTETLCSLGWCVNYDKCQLTPVQSLEFLGLVLSTNKLKNGMASVCVPNGKMQAIRRDAQRLLRNFDQQQRVPVRHLARWVGCATATAKAVAPAGAYLRHCHGLVAAASASSGWNSYTLLTPQVAEELHWWANTMRKSSPWHGRAVLAPKNAVTAHWTVTTDASAWGYGGTLSNFGDSETLLCTQGAWPPAWRAFTWSSNLRETLAVLLVLKAFQAQVAGSTTLVRSDNMTAVATVRRLVGGSHDLNTLAKQLALFSSEHKIFLWSAHIAGKNNNTADALSRRWLATPSTFEWQLAKSALDAVQTRWNLRINIDRFASLATSHCRRFNSFLPQAEAEAVDAFSQRWDRPGDCNLINPPFSLMARVVSKLEAEPNTTAIVVAPHWPAMPWQRRLERLAHDKMLLPPRSFLPPPNPLNNGESVSTPEPLKHQEWRTYAYLLLPSARSCNGGAQQALDGSCWPHSQPAPSAHTSRPSDAGSSTSPSRASPGARPPTTTSPRL